MINTGNGDFASENSPFAQRNWAWGMSGISANVSRDGTSTVIANLPRSNVQMDSINNSGPPFAAGSNIELSGTFKDGKFIGSVNYIGSGTPPGAVSTTTTTTPPPVTTTSSTTTSSTTTSSTTTSSTTTSSTTTSSTTTSSTTTSSTTTSSTPPPTTTSSTLPPTTTSSTLPPPPTTTSSTLPP